MSLHAGIRSARVPVEREATQLVDKAEVLSLPVGDPLVLIQRTGPDADASTNPDYSPGFVAKTARRSAQRCFVVCSRSLVNGPG